MAVKGGGEDFVCECASVVFFRIHRPQTIRIGMIRSTILLTVAINNLEGEDNKNLKWRGSTAGHYAFLRTAHSQQNAYEQLFHRGNNLRSIPFRRRTR
jgi:hypothetical protein